MLYSIAAAPIEQIRHATGLESRSLPQSDTHILQHSNTFCNFQSYESYKVFFESISSFDNAMVES